MCCFKTILSVLHLTITSRTIRTMNSNHTELQIQICIRFKREKVKRTLKLITCTGKKLTEVTRKEIELEIKKKRELEY